MERRRKMQGGDAYINKPIEIVADTDVECSSVDIDKVLEERGKRYGKFTGHARITQAIKKAMRYHTNWEALDDDQKEALEMVAHKCGRILNGDPNYLDNWDDIIGYVKLVTDRRRGNEK